MAASKSSISLSEIIARLRQMRTTNYTLRHRLASVHSPFLPGHPQAMLTKIYIEALLVDEELADQVWEAWDAREER